MLLSMKDRLIQIVPIQSFSFLFLLFFDFVDFIMGNLL